MKKVLLFTLATFVLLSCKEDEPVPVIEATWTDVSTQTTTIAEFTAEDVKHYSSYPKDVDIVFEVQESRIMAHLTTSLSDSSLRSLDAKVSILGGGGGIFYLIKNSDTQELIIHDTDEINKIIEALRSGHNLIIEIVSTHWSIPFYEEQYISMILDSNFNDIYK